MSGRSMYALWVGRCGFSVMPHVFRLGEARRYVVVRWLGCWVEVDTWPR